MAQLRFFKVGAMQCSVNLLFFLLSKGLLRFESNASI